MSDGNIFLAESAIFAVFRESQHSSVFQEENAQIDKNQQGTFCVHVRCCLPDQHGANFTLENVHTCILAGGSGFHRMLLAWASLFYPHLIVLC